MTRLCEMFTGPKEESSNIDVMEENQLLFNRVNCQDENLVRSSAQFYLSKIKIVEISGPFIRV